MPVIISWHPTDPQIICYRISGQWSVSDFFGAIDDLRQQHPEAIHVDFFIVDLRDSQAIPSGILAAREELHRLFLQPGELSVFIGANQFARVIARMLQHMNLLGAIAFADSMQAAEALIRQHPCYRSELR